MKNSNLLTGLITGIIIIAVGFLLPGPREDVRRLFLITLGGIAITMTLLLEFIKRKQG